MRLPVLARSSNRNILPQVHPSSGTPAEWLDACSVSFDFFVDWSNGTLQNEIWVKLLLDQADPAPDAMDPNDLMQRIETSVPSFKKMNAFLEAYTRTVPFCLHYILFDDTQNWSHDDAVIYDVSKDESGWICRRYPLSELKRRIARLTGERRAIGSKGLIYSTSNLETMLSQTDTLWPGDVDAIILQKPGSKPLAILEYRKHTRECDLVSVKEYYVHQDKRKYDRLSILAKAMGLPLIVLTFPTKVLHTQVMLELIRVSDHSLHVDETAYCDLPQNPADTHNLKKSIYSLIRKSKNMGNGSGPPKGPCSSQAAALP